MPSATMLNENRIRSDGKLIATVWFFRNVRRGSGYGSAHQPETSRSAGGKRFLHGRGCAHHRHTGQESLYERRRHV